MFRFSWPQLLPVCSLQEKNSVRGEDPRKELSEDPHKYPSEDPPRYPSEDPHKDTSNKDPLRDPPDDLHKNISEDSSEDHHRDPSENAHNSKGSFLARILAVYDFTFRELNVYLKRNFCPKQRRLSRINYVRRWSSVLGILRSPILGGLAQNTAVHEIDHLRWISVNNIALLYCTRSFLYFLKLFINNSASHHQKW